MIGRLDGRVALITGAASGIGLALARAVARHRCPVVLVDVDEPQLRQAQAQIQSFGVDTWAHVVDVRNYEAMGRLAEQVARDTGGVGLLFNNAGVGLSGSFLDTSLHDWHWIVSTNLMGVVHGCKAFLPQMLGRPGHVVNTASTAGLVAPHYLGAYATTKFAVIGLTEALRGELAGQGIGVSALCPGFVNTAIARRSRMVGTHRADAAIRAQRFFEERGLSAEAVAHAALRGIRRNQFIIPVGLEATVCGATKRWAPWVWDRVNRGDGQAPTEQSVPGVLRLLLRISRTRGRSSEGVEHRASRTL